MSFYMTSLMNCEASGYTHEDKHSMLNTMYGIFQMIFNNKDFGYWNDRLSKLSFFMAIESAKIGEYEQALKELEMMLNHVENYQGFTDISHSSLLVNKIKMNQNDIAKSSEETLAHTCLRYLNREEAVFASVKDDRRYMNIKEHLANL